MKSNADAQRSEKLSRNVERRLAIARRPGQPLRLDCEGKTTKNKQRNQYSTNFKQNFVFPTLPQ